MTECEAWPVGASGARVAIVREGADDAAFQAIVRRHPLLSARLRLVELTRRSRPKDLPVAWLIAIGNAFGFATGHEGSRLVRTSAASRNLTLDDGTRAGRRRRSARRHLAVFEPRE
jgi:hypothetical protein